jgi:WD40 repeat protein
MILRGKSISPFSRHRTGVLCAHIFVLVSASGCAGDGPTQRERSREAQCVAFSSSGDHIAAAVGAALIVWDGDDLTSFRMCGRRPSRIGGIAFLADGQDIAVIDYGGAVSVCDHDKGLLVSKLQLGSDFGRGIDTDREGKLLVTGALKTVSVFAQNWQPLWSQEQNTLVGSVCVSRDGSMVAAGCGDGVYVWNSTNRTALLQGQKDHGGPRSVTFSPDAKLLAAACGDGNIRIWETETFNLVSKTSAHFPSAAQAASFTEDGKRLITAGDDRTARVWKLPEMTELAVLSHPGPVGTLAVSPDGRLLVTGFSDYRTAGTKKPVRLWDLTTNTLKAELAVELP